LGGGIRARCYAFAFALILTSPNFFTAQSLPYFIWVIKLSHLGARKEAGKDFDLSRVEPPITKLIPIIEHFKTFDSCLTKLSDFCVIGR